MRDRHASLPVGGADLVPYIDIGYRDTRLHDLLSPEQEPLVSSLEDIADREFAERAFDWDGEPPWENGETRCGPRGDRPVSSRYRRPSRLGCLRSC